MNFDQWWATLTPAEQRLIGENNAKFVWDSAVEECAKVCEELDHIGTVTQHDCAEAIRAIGQA